MSAPDEQPHEPPSGWRVFAVSILVFAIRDVKGRQISLRSLLMLVLAIAVGLQVGLLLVAPAIQ